MYNMPEDWSDEYVENYKAGHLTIIQMLPPEITRRNVIKHFTVQCDICGTIFNMSAISMNKILNKTNKDEIMCFNCGSKLQDNIDLDIIGKNFGYISALSSAAKRYYYNENGKLISNKRQYWCKCNNCGNIIIVSRDGLMSGDTTSCGCVRIEKIIDFSTTNNISKTKLYAVYSAIIDRCYNQNNKEYYSYGGRGIKVCDEWINKNDDSGVVNFYNWSMNNGYEEGLTIDRINNDGNYCPENCRWVNRITQGNNTSINTFLTYNGETHTMSEWSKIKGISQSTISARYTKYHWNVDKILETPGKSGMFNAVYFTDRFGNPIGNMPDPEVFKKFENEEGGNDLNA